MNLEAVVADLATDRGLRWLWIGVWALFALAMGACMAKGADRPADPALQDSSRVPGFAEVGFQVDPASGAVTKHCALLANTEQSARPGAHEPQRPRRLRRHGLHLRCRHRCPVPHAGHADPAVDRLLRQRWSLRVGPRHDPLHPGHGLRSTTAPPAPTGPPSRWPRAPSPASASARGVSCTSAAPAPSCWFARSRLAHCHPAPRAPAPSAPTDDRRLLAPAGGRVGAAAPAGPRCAFSTRRTPGKLVTGSRHTRGHGAFACVE